jgi:hypothetical protein
MISSAASQQAMSIKSGVMTEIRNSRAVAFLSIVDMLMGIECAKDSNLA